MRLENVERKKKKEIEKLKLIQKQGELSLIERIRALERVIYGEDLG
jgi:hypothetical protein